jgi:hypothetical protein
LFWVRADSPASSIVPFATIFRISTKEEKKKEKKTEKLTSSPPGGGSPLSTNRTKWPVTGGAVAFQPGWFSGHAATRLYINLGEGTNPPNMSLPMVPEVGMLGPTNDQYPDLEVCFPQVPLPAHYNAKIGDNATIQVIMLAQHGASLYSVSGNLFFFLATYLFRGNSKGSVVREEKKKIWRESCKALDGRIL